MKKLLQKIDNAYIAALNWSTSTKGAMYLLTGAIWIAVAINPPKTIYEWLTVIVSVYYQGVALSALGYQQKFESADTRQLMIDIHDDEKEEITDLKAMQEESHVMLNEIKDMHGELKEILTKLEQK